MGSIEGPIDDPADCPSGEKEICIETLETECTTATSQECRDYEETECVVSPKEVCITADQTTCTDTEFQTACTETKTISPIPTAVAESISVASHAISMAI